MPVHPFFDIYEADFGSVWNPKTHHKQSEGVHGTGNGDSKNSLHD